MKTLLILVSITGIAAVVVTIIVGTSTFEGTVVRDPYEAGLRYDADQRARADTGWRISLLNGSFTAGVNECTVSLTDREGAPVDDAVITMQLSYPSTDRYDREVPLSPDGNGRYRGMLALPRKGPWTVQFVIVRGDRTARFQESIYVATHPRTRS